MNNENENEKPLSLNLTVRGSDNIEFSNMGMDLIEGHATGDMKQFGLAINTAWCSDMDQRLGGCLDREQVRTMRDYLNQVIAKWDNEEPTDKTPHEIMMDNVNAQEASHD
jgi:hypothetical protein